MKKTLAFALIVASLGLTHSAFAQTTGPVGLPPRSSVAPLASKHGAKAKHEGKHLPQAIREKIKDEALSKMNLTTDQVAKIRAHESESDAKRAALKPQAKAAKKEKRQTGVLSPAGEQMKAIRKDHKRFMKQILTKPQRKEFARLRREAAKSYSLNGDGLKPVTKP